MKKYSIALSFLLIAMCGLTAVAQDFSGLDKSPMDIAWYPASHGDSQKNMRIIYSRPQLKGRDIAQLAPAGKVWRTGANETPEITFYNDVDFGGTKVKAGTYSLLTVPGSGTWEIILNSDLNQWGAYSYNKDHDVARVSAEAYRVNEALEAFSITFQSKDDGAEMFLGWGNTRVKLPIGF